MSKPSSTPIMRYDDVLCMLGEFGRYQRIVYTLLCLPVMFVGMHIMSPVFILATPNHRCAIPGMPNDTYEIQSENHLALVQFYIPSDNKDGGYEKCNIYSRSVSYIEAIETNLTHHYPPDNITVETMACHNWVFDKSVFDNTATTETQLVCAHKIYRAHATTAQYAGSVFSFLAGGQVADRFGRKRASSAGLIVMAISSTLLIWLPNIAVFIIIRMVIGLGFGLFYNVIFVYALEFVGPSKRTVFGITINHFWAVGLMLQSLCAYYVRAWRTLELIMSLPFMVVLLYWWKLPNSGRWLFTKGYIDQGKKVVLDMARVNKVHIDGDDMSIDVDDDEDTGGGCMVIELINHRSQAVRSLVVWYNWFVVSLLYYGLSLNIENLGGDIILNFALSSLMEFLGYTLCIPGIYKYGRTRFHCACMIIGGAALLLVIFPELFGNTSTQWVKILFSMIGKLASSAAFAIAYLYSAELFPTILRGTALGISAASATLGAFTAPYIVEMANLLSGHIAKILPLVVFGITAVTAGLLALSLPETSNRKLPDTIKDMKMHKK